MVAPGAVMCNDSGLVKEGSSMKVLLNSILFFSMCLGFALPASSQSSREEIKKKVDAIVTQAYKEAIAKFPCRLGTSGKAKMGRWKDVENCVNPANDLVDWEGHAAALKRIREEERLLHQDLVVVVEEALTVHALPYDKVFSVKEKEESAALLPLSNSLLKFLPEGSLTDLMVHDDNGELIGIFLGSYPFDRSGGLTVLGEYRRMSFQYNDLRGDAQTPTSVFLLDSFGVPWRDAMHQPGFRLSSNRLVNWR